MVYVNRLLKVNNVKDARTALESEKTPEIAISEPSMIKDTTEAETPVKRPKSRGKKATE